MATDTLSRDERTPETEADDAARHLFELYMARHHSRIP